jgi:DNA-binding IclR family transcriptional regulator
MSSDEQRRYVDALSMSAAEAQVYEAIAALEYSGRPASGAEIAHAVDLDQSTVTEALHTLTEREAVIRRGTGDEAEYEPASRAWTVMPPGE